MTARALPVAGVGNGPAAPGEIGLGASGVLGVDFAALSPLGTQQPVYPDAEDVLRAGPDADHRVAHVLATLAGYAYGDALTVSMMATRLGLEGNRCQTVDETVDAMFIRSTAHVVQSATGRVLVIAYRGTEPTNLISWLTDGDLDPEIQRRQDVDGDPMLRVVHAGFYRNVRATRFHLARVMLDALEGPIVPGGPRPPQPLGPLEAVYITGHSLGGAMALIHAALLARDARRFPEARELWRLVRGVYTFGGPMVGGPEFAHLCRALGVTDRVRRYAYRNDPVPALPPRLSGPYAHVGHGYRLEPDRRVVDDPSAGQAFLLPLLLSPLAFLARQVAVLRGLEFPYSLGAHAPQNYIAALAPPGTTEFGRPREPAEG